MATKKTIKEEIKEEVPVVKASGNEDYPIDRIIVKGKSCIASIEINLNTKDVLSGYLDINGEILPFTAII